MEGDKSHKQGRPAPPAENRWKKGVSGNLRGRPKKQDNLTSLFKEEIAKVCPTGREKRTWSELVVKATFATALEEVWERLDGKVVQTEKMQWEGADGKPIRIKAVYPNDNSGE